MKTNKWYEACIKAQADLIKKLKREIINLKARLGELHDDKTINH